MDPNPGTGAFVIEKRRRFGHGHTDTHRRKTACDDGGRLEDAAVSPGVLRIPSSRYVGRGKKDSSLEPSEGARPCWHLDFRLLASRSTRERVSYV